MPARRRSIRDKNKSKTRRRGLRSVIFILILILLLPIIYFSLKGEIWDKESNLAVAVMNGNDINVLVFNPQKSEVYNITIPGNTQVNAVGDRGVWRLKSIWQLGYDEKLDGNFFADTIKKNFFIPIKSWGDSDFLNYYEGNLLGIVRTTLFPGSTNLKIGDRISLARFSLGVKDINKYQVDLKKSDFLTLVNLKDGGEGYIIGESFPVKLLPMFSDFTGIKAQTVSIVNVSESEFTFDSLAKVIEVLGAKVVSTQGGSFKNYPKDTDCYVEGSRAISLSIARVLNCKIAKADARTSIDATIIIGSRFVKRF